MSSAPPVNLQVNNPDDLANMLFTDNTNVNMKHLHEGMLSHTDAINQLAVNQARPGGVFARKEDNLLQALAMNEVDAVRHLANQEEEIEDKSEE